jgi:O-antigen/teichoic acid export membrane protein
MTPEAARAAPARSIGSNVRATLVGNVVYAVGLWVQLVIFARQGGPEAVGAYAFALALTTPVMMLSYLQLRILLASDARGEYRFREYRQLRFATTAAALVTMVPVAWSTGQWRTVWPILGPVCAKAAADALADVYCALWQQHERMGVIGWALTINAIASVAFMAAGALLGGGTPTIATGAALGSCASLLFVHLKTAWDPELRSSIAPGVAPVEWRRLARLAREAAPLGLIVLLGSLLLNVPRYFIRHYAGEAALGLFAAAFQLTATGGMIVQTLGGAATPRLARACAEEDAATFKALVRKLVLSAAALGVLGVATSVLIGRPVLSIVFRPEFGSAAGVLVVLSVAAGIGFVATLVGYALTAARAIGVQPVLLSATLAVASACCAVLVPMLGAAGAAWALVVASVVQAVWSSVALSRLRVRASRAPGAVEAA